jgi:hypothetical protein
MHAFNRACFYKLRRNGNLQWVRCHVLTAVSMFHTNSLMTVRSTSRPRRQLLILESNLWHASPSFCQEPNSTAYSALTGFE